MPLVIGPLLVGLLPFLAAIVLVGLSQASTSQHGSSNSGTFWDVITGRAYFHQLAGFAANFARWIVSHFAAGQLRILARWFTGIGTLTLGWFTANPAALEAIVHAIERVYHAVPGIVHRAVQPVHRLAVKAEHTALHGLRLARGTLRALHRYEARVNARLHGIEHSVAVTLPRDIGRIRSREEALSRDITKLWKRTKILEHGAIKTFDWIRTHPFGAAATMFSLAISAVLPRLGLDFLRCNNRTNVGGLRGCALWDALEGLLGLALTTLAIDNLDALVREAQALEQEVVVGIQDLFGVG